MATVSKKIADDIIAGMYSDDPQALRIVQYTTPEGDPDNYGVIYNLRDWDKYRASPYVCSPQVYWEDDNAAAELHRELAREDDRMLDEMNGIDEGDFF
jgi:hypothetical protein